MEVLVNSKNINFKEFQIRVFLAVFPRHRHLDKSRVKPVIDRNRLSQYRQKVFLVIFIRPFWGGLFALCLDVGAVERPQEKLHKGKSKISFTYPKNISIDISLLFKKI